MPYIKTSCSSVSAMRSEALGILGVEEGASAREIRSKFKQLALKAHPDKPGGSTASFQRLVNAYEHLNTDDSSSSYVNEGSNRQSATEASARKRKAAPTASSPHHGGDHDSDHDNTEDQEVSDEEGKEDEEGEPWYFHFHFSFFSPGFSSQYNDSN